MLQFFLTDRALRQFESASQSGGTAMFRVNDWPSAVIWLIRTYAKKLAINKAVDRFRLINQREGKDDLAHFNRFEEWHARCGEYFTSAQLNSAYIESVDERIRPYLWEAKHGRLTGESISSNYAKGMQPRLIPSKQT